MFVTSFDLSRPGMAIVTLGGVIDHKNGEPFSQELTSLQKLGFYNIVVDCTNTTVVCSQTYGAIAQATKRCREAGGDLRLVGVNNHLHRILEVLHLLDYVTICQSVDVAVASFRPTPDLEDTL